MKSTPRKAEIAQDFWNNLFLGEVGEIFAVVLAKQDNTSC